MDNMVQANMENRQEQDPQGNLILTPTGIEELGRLLTAAPAWKDVMRQLFPVEVMKAVPQFFSQERLKAAGKQKEGLIVYAKLFTPWTSWTWYILEWQPQWDRATTGQVFYDIFIYCWTINSADPGNAELGYTAISELKGLEGFGGLKVERDVYFDPTPLKEVKAQHNINDGIY